MDDLEAKLAELERQKQELLKKMAEESAKKKVVAWIKELGL